MNDKFKYSWQQVVLEAFVEVRPEYLPEKIKAAQRAISERLSDQQRPPNLEEHAALHGAFRSLMVLRADQTGNTKKLGDKEIA